MSPSSSTNTSSSVAQRLPQSILTLMRSTALTRLVSWFLKPWHIRGKKLDKGVELLRRMPWYHQIVTQTCLPGISSSSHFRLYNVHLYTLSAPMGQVAGEPSTQSVSNSLSSTRVLCEALSYHSRESPSFLDLCPVSKPTGQDTARPS